MDIEESSKVFFKDFFSAIGEDGTREGLKDTNMRFLDSMKTLYSGYGEDPHKILSTTFVTECDEMVIVKDIEFYSMCEHHLLPFFGHISIGYIPSDRLVGISSLARLVEIYARRLQIQERLTTQIADTIADIVKPKGIMVVCKARHMCMEMRGVESKSASVLTSALRGLFKKDSKTRAEFLDFIKG
ncbi:GTP cyclohydrolase I FolE [Helicobacter sp. 11S02629-2]|uniref:GTP cyclohydrolase I FolE n=1 Tax=Helicobacter sp. 11S02629-2 TaxID=1476195 RepID=UPI000BA58D78|nr:GTP cyclohydrolase I FolE [Helicobacter sp. 11S02629-2]PAF44080.1 GTP cyclohydrolase I FolE [Helicobacter sp. 11S02629-2]